VRLIRVGEVHAVAILQAGDDARAVLHFQVGTQDLDVHALALARGFAFGAGEVEGEIAVVRVDEFLYCGVHGAPLFACGHLPQMQQRP